MSATHETIVQQSYALAAKLNHELVTLEHILQVLLENTEVIDLLKNTNANVDEIKRENSAWLDDSNNNPPPLAGMRQRHTTLVANVFKKSMAQNIFKEKKQIDSIDLLLNMFDIEDSPASYFLHKHTIGRQGLIDYINSSSGMNSEMSHDDALVVLRTYCVNLNDRAKNGKIDNLIGREKEVESITQILARRTKHNLILIGQPGVGKTVMIEGLAKRIVDGDVPEILMDKVIWSLDITSIVAGTKFRGDFEERMKSIIQALKSCPEAITFIDEIHMIMGAGSGGGGNGTLDAANILKPALSRGEFCCIGSTTEEEYRKHFEKDRAITRRFQKLDIFEPSISDAKKIIKGIAKYYEEFHGVTYTEEALDASVELTARYMHDKQLPDKAIDVIDSAAAWQKIKPVEQQKLNIDISDIELEVGRISKRPIAEVTDTDAVKLHNLSNDLHDVIVGQDLAIQTLVDSVYLSRSGLHEHDKTQGAYLFVGPTGSGKTALATQLAKTLNIELIRFDMSEYMEKHRVSTLIGAPPGYVGFGDGGAGSGLLINAIEKNPHAVLLLDEVEKAHPDIFNILLQVMDNGIITNAAGKSVNARNIILIMTTNLGATDMARESIGFRKIEKDDDTKAIDAFFPPEFRNRLDAVVKFNRLSKDNMSKIVDKFINDLRVLSLSKNVTINIDKVAKDWLIDKGFDKLMGARPLKRVISDNIKKPLSKEILFGKLKNGGAVSVTVKDDTLVFEFPNSEAINELISEINESRLIEV